nr:PREDICTED: F-box only protein 33 [Equus przewalskii]
MSHTTGAPRSIRVFRRGSSPRRPCRFSAAPPRPAPQSGPPSQKRLATPGAAGPPRGTLCAGTRPRVLRRHLRDARGPASRSSHYPESRHLRRLSARLNRLQTWRPGGRGETGGAALRGNPRPPRPAGLPTCVTGHVPRRPSLPATGRSPLPEVAPVAPGSSHRRRRQAQLLPLPCLRLQARGGLRAPDSPSGRFRAPRRHRRDCRSSWACGPRPRPSRAGEARGRLSGGRPHRGLSPSPHLGRHLVPPRPTTVPPPSSLSLMLLFLSAPQPRPPGARSRAGAARVARWRRQRLRLQQLRRLRGLLRGLRGRPGAGGRRRGRMALCGQLSIRWLEVLRTYLELVLCVLVSIRNNRNLQKFSLFGDISILQQQGSLSNTYLSKADPDGKTIKQIQQLFEEILSNSRQLKWLSCGFMLEIVTPTSLSSLSNSIANTMEHLSLLDNNIPGNSTLITAVELERFVNLRSLALDFCDFTAEMARVLTDSNHVPLQRLSLLVHNVSVMHKSLDNMPNDEHWKALSRKSTSLRVYVMAFDVKSEDMLKILKPSIPLERIHFDSYITCVSGAIVDLISRQYDKFLTHFILMNDVIDMSGFPDLSDNRNEDPLVLLAWRCTKLSLLAVHGYTVWAHNLIAIARLRGSDLKVLEVTEESIDFDQGELADQDVDPVHNLIEQVSLGLGQPWHAVMDIESLSVFTEPNRHFYREMQSFSEDI